MTTVNTENHYEADLISRAHVPIRHLDTGIEMSTIGETHTSTRERNDGRRLSDENVTPRPLAPSRTNPVSTSGKLRFASCGLCFFVAGLNDGCIGALIPFLLTEYAITTSFVGIVYGVNFAGWAIAAVLMPFSKNVLGLKGTLLLGAALYTIAQALRVWTPPYPVYCVSYLFSSLGQAFQDAQANTFVSTMSASHIWLGMIHSAYALGLLVAPLIATSIASSDSHHWATFYAIPLGIGVFNFILVILAFFPSRQTISSSNSENSENRPWSNNRLDDLAASAQHSRSSSSPARPLGKFLAAKNEMKETLQVRAVWLISIFFFFHLGALFTITNWIVVFLSTVRGLPVSQAGYVPTGFYGGMLLGRLIMPQPTHTWLGGEHHMLSIYSAAMFGLELIVWRVDSAVGVAVAYSIMGFFSGPFFAAAIQVASEVIPRKVSGNALGVIFVVAQLGANVFPAVAGTVAASDGTEVMQPIALGLIAAMGVAWWVVPTAPRSRGEDEEGR